MKMITIVIVALCISGFFQTKSTKSPLDLKRYKPGSIPSYASLHPEENRDNKVPKERFLDLPKSSDQGKLVISVPKDCTITILLRKKCEQGEGCGLNTHSSCSDDQLKKADFKSVDSQGQSCSFAALCCGMMCLVKNADNKESFSTKGDISRA